MTNNMKKQMYINFFCSSSHQHTKSMISRASQNWKSSTYIYISELVDEDEKQCKNQAYCVGPVGTQ